MMMIIEVEVIVKIIAKIMDPAFPSTLLRTVLLFSPVSCIPYQRVTFIYPTSLTGETAEAQVI